MPAGVSPSSLTYTLRLLEPFTAYPGAVGFWMLLPGLTCLKRPVEQLLLGIIVELLPKQQKLKLNVYILRHDSW